MQNKNNCYISLKDPRFNYSYKGFCSIVCQIISISLEHYSVFDNFNILVDEPQTLEFFDCISHKDNLEYYDGGSWVLDRFFAGKIIHNKYSSHTLANIDNLKLQNKCLKNILNLKPKYQNQFEEKYKNLGISKNTLGIQIRGTDKKTEIKEPNSDTIFQKIDLYFLEKEIKNIFVCTDDKKYLDLLIGRYGDKIIYDNSLLISENSEPIHKNPKDRSRINLEVLSSVYLLSKCRYFLYCFSNVSLLALIMGSNNFISIDNIND